MAVSFGSSVDVGKSDSVEFAGNRRLKFQLRLGHRLEFHACQDVVPEGHAERREGAIRITVQACQFIDQGLDALAVDAPDVQTDHQVADTIAGIAPMDAVLGPLRQIGLVVGQFIPQHREPLLLLPSRERALVVSFRKPCTRLVRQNTLLSLFGYDHTQHVVAGHK
ncbi:hypothetical protein, partial [Verminephrobacter aporrectodeae]|uniref:hypothetical protein n=1 Tax=Verminephrobacter aporrectodeae TaxID=1110389 RepID=UPI002243778A